MSGLIYPLQSLILSYLRSVSHDKQTSCLSVLHEIYYWYIRDKRITRHLSWASGPSACGDWAHRGFHSCTDLFESMKRYSVQCAWAGSGVTLLEQAVDLYIPEVKDVVSSVVRCTRKLHILFLLFVDRLGGRKTEAKNSWQDNERKATHLLSENIYKYNCHCSFIRMFLLYL